MTKYKETSLAKPEPFLLKNFSQYCRHYWDDTRFLSIFTIISEMFLTPSQNKTLLDHFETFYRSPELSLKCSKQCPTNNMI